MKKIQNNRQIIAVLLAAFLIICSVTRPVFGAETGETATISETAEENEFDEVVEDGENTFLEDEPKEEIFLGGEPATEDDFFIEDGEEAPVSESAQNGEFNDHEIDSTFEEEYENFEIGGSVGESDVDTEQLISENQEEHVDTDEQAIGDADILAAEPGYDEDSSFTEPRMNSLEANGSVTTVGENIVASGLCGESVTWTLYTSGLLAISGDGEMTDYDLVADVPWNKYKLKITSILINENVKHVGKNIFHSLKNLTTVSLPEGLVSIGYDAFLCCYALTSINIPNSIEMIDMGALGDCVSLGELSVPGNLKTIPPCFLLDCIKLKQIDISDGVELIDNSAFEGCSSLTTLQIPGTVSTIGSNAFGRCTNLTEVSLPASLKSIGENAFIDCSSLTDIYYSGDETQWSIIEGITNASIPETVEIHYNSHTLERKDYAESTCTENGVIEHYECIYCGKLFEDPDGQIEISEENILIPSKGHLEVVDEAIPATCTETGLTEGSHCSSCGEVFVAQEVIPATGHTIVEDKPVAATCLTPGLSQGTHCSICGEIILAQEAIPATGHTIEEDKPVAATCITPGLSQGAHCSVCGEIISAQEEIMTLGHTFSEWKTIKAATLTSEGEQERECERCGFTERQVIPELTVKSITPSIDLSQAEFTYNGNVQKPSITVRDGNNILSSDNYDVSFDGNLTDVGSYIINVELKGVYSGTATASYRITPRNITPAVTLSETSFVYNGKVQKPSVYVKDGEHTLSSENYTISFDREPVNRGTYKATIELKKNYTGSATTSFTIIAKSIAPTVALSKTSYTYNGKIQKPSVTVKDGTSILDGSNYTVTYASGLKNAGMYKIEVKMKGNYSGSATKSFRIDAKNVTPQVILSTTTYTYDGKTKTPAVTVKIGEARLEKTAYTISYANGRKNAGNYNVIVKLKGNYTGSKTVAFKIVSRKITPNVSLSKKVYIYNGKVQKPSITVKAGSTKLATSGYSVTFAKGLINVGTYKITIKLKGNYSGSKVVTYKINPRPTTIISSIRYYDRIVAKWAKREKQTTGYQIQYSTNSKFSSGNKVATIANSKTATTTLKKLQKGKNYYVRIRTYKRVGSVTYYSSWSQGINTAIKQTIKAKTSLWMDYIEDPYGTFTQKVSYKFTTNQRMMFVVPISVDSPNGGERFRLILKDENGKIHQNDIVSTDGYDSYDTYDNWYCNDTFFVQPGTYTYSLEMIDGGYNYVTYSILGFLAQSTSATMKSQITSQSGKWIKVGRIGEGCPLCTLTSTNASIINSYEVRINGDVYVWTEKKGNATLTMTLPNGKKYSSNIKVVAGEPDFIARITQYNTRDNYFEVSVENYRPSDVTIIRKGAKVEDVDYKSFDRKLKPANNVVIKSGEKKYIRFYVDGATTWPDYEDYTLLAKFAFEGITYDWHVRHNDSVYKKNGSWWTTYW